MMITRTRWLIRLTCAWLSATTANAALGQGVLSKEIVVHAPRTEIWRGLTTNAGLDFVSGRSNVDIRRNGPYE